MNKFNDLKKVMKEKNLELRLFDPKNATRLCQLWEIKKDKTRLFKGFRTVVELYFTFGVK